MKRIVYISGSRAEYGIMKRLLLELKKNENIELKIIATAYALRSKVWNAHTNILRMMALI